MLFDQFDFDRIDPRALRHLQNRSEASPGHPRELPVATQDPSRIQGPPQRPQKGSQRLHKGVISCSGRCRNNIRARTFRQKPTSKQTSEHISRAEDPPNSILARRNTRSVQIRCIHRIHGVWESVAFPPVTWGGVPPPAKLVPPTRVRRMQRMGRCATEAGPENHRFHYYTSARASWEIRRFP